MAREPMSPNLFQGIGALDRVPHLPFFSSGRRRILLLHSSGRAMHESFRRLLAAFGDRHDLALISFSTPILDEADIEKVLARARSAGSFEVDLIFALGGGSVIDLAKCLKAKFLLEGRSPELWVVPTTAGTGSEATPFATFFRGRSKQSLEDARILSDQVILDPLLLKGMHPRIAAPCALDALTQAIESLWSVRATDASRSFAMDAIALWLKSWKAALFNDEIAAWETMQIAAYRSGQAIAISRTTLAHALSYWLTAQKGVPHGLAVFLCLSPVILFNANEARAKNSILALERLFSVNSPQELVRKLQEILQAFGYHQDLRAYGVCVETEFIDFLRSAANNPRSGNNPRPIELGEIRKAFQRVGAYS